MLIQWDHKNVEHCQTFKVLYRRQARWLETLSAYNFVIEHLEGSKTWPDGPSRRSDYQIGYESPVARGLATVLVEPYDNLIPAISVAHAPDPLAVEVSARIVDPPIIDTTDTTKEENKMKVVA